MSIVYVVCILSLSFMHVYAAVWSPVQSGQSA
jgi:hypothetical protein